MALGQCLGARYLTTSHLSLGRSGPVVVLQTRIFDVSTGEILWADEVVGAPGDLGFTAFKGSDEELGALVSWLLEQVRAIPRKAAPRLSQLGS